MKTRESKQIRLAGAASRLFALIVAMVMILFTAGAYAGDDIPQGPKKVDVPEGVFDTNYGHFEYMRNVKTTIRTNQGTIENFYSGILENNGENGTIGEYCGSGIENNNGTIDTILTISEAQPTVLQQNNKLVEKVFLNSVIVNNSGTVETNYGTIENCFGGSVLVNEKQGTVGGLRDDAVVGSNYGTVTFGTLGGTVENNYGTVNLGANTTGVVTNNYGIINGQVGQVGNIWYKLVLDTVDGCGLKLNENDMTRIDGEPYVKATVYSLDQVQYCRIFVEFTLADGFLCENDGALPVGKGLWMIEPSGKALSPEGTVGGSYKLVIRADPVAEKINAIGTVEYTDESWSRIDAARKAYDALTDTHKKRVSDTQLKILTDAEAEYARLKKEAEDKAKADQAAADAVTEKINAIGTVEYTDASRDKIETARKAYEALTDDQKALVSDTQLKILTDAEKEYARLKKEAEDKAKADQEAADAVIEKINAIGTVEYTDASRDKIEAARKAYNALTEDQKALVPEQQVKAIADAEKLYEELKKQNETPEYKILDGADSVWVKASGTPVVIRGSGKIEDYTGLEIDGQTVDREEYTVRSGSTIIELRSRFLERLKLGKHKLVIRWKDGFVSTTLTINPAIPGPLPPTGDPAPLLLWLALLALSCGICVWLGKRMKT